MNNKCILITGASSGIGKCFAEYASSLGAIVVLVARQENVLKEIQQALPGRSFIFAYDLCDLENISSIFDFVKAQGMKLDGMVHCAGVTCIEPIRVVGGQETEQVMCVNALSFIQLGRFFSMKKFSNERASVVAISSLASFYNTKGGVVYNASKAAVNSAVETMAKEFLNRRIRVNAIAPAFVETPMAHDAFERVDGGIERFEREQELGLIPTEQISYAIDFLLSDRSAYITGTVIPISAGKI